MRRPMIIGECSPKGERALSPDRTNSSGERLWKIVNAYAEISKDDFVRDFDLRNLCCQSFNMVEARATAELIKNHIEPDARVFLLGQKVQAAFNLLSPIDKPVCHLVNGAFFHCIPHPSGLCRDYNDPEIRKRVGYLITTARRFYLEAHSSRGSGQRRKVNARKGDLGGAEAPDPSQRRTKQAPWGGRGKSKKVSPTR